MNKKKITILLVIIILAGSILPFVLIKNKTVNNGSLMRSLVLAALTYASDEQKFPETLQDVVKMAKEIDPDIENLLKLNGIKLSEIQYHPSAKKGCDVLMVYKNTVVFADGHTGSYK